MYVGNCTCKISNCRCTLSNCHRMPVICLVTAQLYHQLPILILSARWALRRLRNLCFFILRRLFLNTEVNSMAVCVLGSTISLAGLMAIHGNIACVVGASIVTGLAIVDAIRQLALSVFNSANMVMEKFDLLDFKLLRVHAYFATS